MFETNNYKEAPVLCELKRKETPLTVKVEIDDNIRETAKNFDYDFTGISEVFPFEIPKELPRDFKMLVITGSSGSGKSTLLKEFEGYKENNYKFDDRAIISQFPDFETASNRLIGVGLNSIPTWCKPYHVLSVGESFRAMMACNLDSYTIFDEFTSTIDRNVAKGTSKGIAKLIEKEKLHNVIFCSCHNDYIPFLNPDYVIDTDEEKIYDCSEVLLRQEIRIEVYEASDKSDWHKFCKHHYLSTKHNNAARVYKAYWDDNCIGWYSILPMPTGQMKNAFRGHRQVILPDYQGIGISMKFRILVDDQEYLNKGKKITYRQTHKKVNNYFRKHTERFEEKASSGKISSDGGNSHKLPMKYDTNRICWSFENRGIKWSLPHKMIILDDDTEFSRLELLKCAKSNYLTIITGRHKINNKWEELAHKHGIRTELLYLNKKGVEIRKFKKLQVGVILNDER